MYVQLIAEAARECWLQHEFQHEWAHREALEKQLVVSPVLWQPKRSAEHSGSADACPPARTRHARSLARTHVRTPRSLAHSLARTLAHLALRNLDQPSLATARPPARPPARTHDRTHTCCSWQPPPPPRATLSPPLPPYTHLACSGGGERCLCMAAQGCI